METDVRPGQGANALRTRHHNRRLVLSRVRAAGRIGRAELARATGLSTQAVSNIIADLIGEGVLQELGRASVSRGQPPVLYALRPQARAALGAELRPDALFVALLDLDGTPLGDRRIALPRATPDAVIAELLSARSDLLLASGMRPAQLLGTGLVMPGPFGTTGARAPDTELPDWQGVDPLACLTEALGSPVLVENDANAAAMAERIAGAAEGIDDYLYLYFGRGLGLGVVAQGRLLRGAHGNAGEVGRLLTADGLPLEALASRHALQSDLARAGSPADTLSALASRHQEDHSAVTNWLDRAAPALAAAIVLLENLFDPQTVLLGGALPAPLLDALIARIELADTSIAHRPDRRHQRLMRGSCGPRAATLGAAALVIDHSLTPHLTA